MLNEVPGQWLVGFIIKQRKWKWIGVCPNEILMNSVDVVVLKQLGRKSWLEMKALIADRNCCRDFINALCAHNDGTRRNDDETNNKLSKNDFLGIFARLAKKIIYF